MNVQVNKGRLLTNIALCFGECLSGERDSFGVIEICKQYTYIKVNKTCT